MISHFDVVCHFDHVECQSSDACGVSLTLVRNSTDGHVFIANCLDLLIMQSNVDEQICLESPAHSMF